MRCLITIQEMVFEATDHWHYTVNDIEYGRSSGADKKIAKEMAAREAYAKMHK